MIKANKIYLSLNFIIPKKIFYSKKFFFSIQFIIDQNSLYHYHLSLSYHHVQLISRKTPFPCKKSPSQLGVSLQLLRPFSPLRRVRVLILSRREVENERKSKKMGWGQAWEEPEITFWNWVSYFLFLMKCSGRGLREQILKVYFWSCKCALLHSYCVEGRWIFKFQKMEFRNCRKKIWNLEFFSNFDFLKF